MGEHRWADVRGWGGAPHGTLQCDLCNRVASPTDPKREALISSDCAGRPTPAAPVLHPDRASGEEG